MPFDTATIAAWIGYTVGLVALARKRFPKLDGDLLFAFVPAMAILVTLGGDAFGWLEGAAFVAGKSLGIALVKVVLGAFASFSGTAALAKIFAGRTVPLTLGEVLSTELPPAPPPLVSTAVAVAVKAASTALALGCIGALLVALFSCSAAQQAAERSELEKLQPAIGQCAVQAVQKGLEDPKDVGLACAEEIGAAVLAQKKTIADAGVTDAKADQ